MSARGRADEEDQRQYDSRGKMEKDSVVKMSEETAKDARQERGSGKMDKMIESKKHTPEKEKANSDKGRARAGRTEELYNVQGFPELDEMFDHVQKVCACMYVCVGVPSNAMLKPCEVYMFMHTSISLFVCAGHRTLRPQGV
jgi:hypothetical protein